MVKATVLGAGTWGIALARLLAINGHQVTVWSAIPSELDQRQETTKRDDKNIGADHPRYGVPEGRHSPCVSVRRRRT